MATTRNLIQGLLLPVWMLNAALSLVKPWQNIITALVPGALSNYSKELRLWNTVGN